MAKFYGKVGFAESVETAPDVYVNKIVERLYTGDVVRSSFRWQNAQQVNDNFTIGNRISILCDAYASSHLGQIRYVQWHGSNWKVSNVEVQFPRLILELGDIYNGSEADVVD